MKKPSKRVLKGWAFDETVHAGMRIRCTPLFRYRSQAEEVADRFAYKGRPAVVRATLTLEATKPRKKRARS